MCEELRTLSTIEQSMLPSLLTFFNDEQNFEILKRYRNGHGKTKYSASLLDWFTVNYAKEYGVSYKIKRNGRLKFVLVEQSYNAALSANNKEYFDPFARGSKQGYKITIVNSKGEYIETAIRQLNFFRWAINNGVIEYVDKHVDDIYDDMCKRSNRGKRKGAKKQQLSVSASKSLGIHSVKMTVKFEKK